MKRSVTSAGQLQSKVWKASEMSIVWKSAVAAAVARAANDSCCRVAASLRPCSSPGLLVSSKGSLERASARVLSLPLTCLNVGENSSKSICQVMMQLEFTHCCFSQGRMEGLACKQQRCLFLPSWRRRSCELTRWGSLCRKWKA